MKKLFFWLAAILGGIGAFFGIKYFSVKSGIDIKIKNLGWKKDESEPKRDLMKNPLTDEEIGDAIEKLKKVSADRTNSRTN